jgi:hypothetical protein
VSEHVPANVESAPQPHEPALGPAAERAELSRSAVSLGGSRPAAGRLDPSTLLALQRTAGNVAVARWVARGQDGDPVEPPSRPRPATRTLSRYEAGEHARFGGDDTVLVNGVPISRGNIIAMGDFFRTPEDMNRADPEVLWKLDWAITQDRRARAHEKGPDGQPLTPPSNDDIQKITEPLGQGSTYMDLNKENQAHFAPPKDGASPDGKDHKSAFEKFHRQALDEAHKVAPQMSVDPSSGATPADGAPAAGAPGAGASSQPPPNASGPPSTTTQGPGATPSPGSTTAAPAKSASTVPANAIATNMFAAHFLTDAFAAGHLINKKEVVDQAKVAWDKMNNTGGFLLRENTFTQEVSRRVLADAAVTAKMVNMPASASVPASGGSWARWRARFPARLSAAWAERPSAARSGTPSRATTTSLPSGCRSCFTSHPAWIPERSSTSSPAWSTTG